MKHALNLIATALLATSLAACDAIGDGNTIESLEVLPANGATQLKVFEPGDTHKLFQCLRDELLVKATFTDGTEANFSGRAIWTSSDPSVVEVSNGEIPATFLVGNPAADGTFYESQTTNFVSGTLIPRGTPGQTAVITARFSKLSASMTVEIRKPALRIVNVPNQDPGPAAPPYYLAQGSTQRLTVLVDADGRTVRLSDLSGAANSININPVRWVFTGGTFLPEDPDVVGDVDRWAIDVGADRIATIGALDATVTGVEADFTPHEVFAESSLCQASVTVDPELRPVASVQVATLYDDPGTPEDDRLVLTREPGFTGGGFATDDIVIGTNHQLQLRARLDAEGDGSLIVDQHFNTQGRYATRPLDSGCDVADDLLGCTANSMMSVAGGFAVAAAGSAEGTLARMQACTPLCQQAQATLVASATTVGTGVPVDFTATALSVPAGITVNYLFDFGDGTTAGPQAAAVASHAYATADFYTATVRLVDAAYPAEFLSQNAGAARVLAGVTPPAGNTAPTAAVLVSNAGGGEAPFQTLLDATESSDSNASDSITVYEFDPGNGTPAIRQNRPTLSYTYVDGGSFTPRVRVYDESGVPSPFVDAAAPVVVTGTAAEFIRSNVVEFRGRRATLCAIEIQPPLASAPTEAAFTFPGQRFETVGAFVADTDTDTCADPLIGTQRITRHMVWTVRLAGVTDGLSEVVQIRSNTDDFQVPGQVVYTKDVAVPTLLDVDAFPQTPFSNQIDAPLTQLTVTPCTGCTP
jgi:hypothetical protein